VACVSAKGCSVRRSVGEVRGTKARGRKRRQCKGRVGGDCVREARPSLLIKREWACVGLKTSNVAKYSTTLLLV
jgi:hypothetical protein